MKFLCDKCKTRYSIGDDRVRGKILKIRCKNCANVITVREGMPDPGLDRAIRETSAFPTVTSSELAPSPAPAAQGGALGAAFASQLAKPPPALEQEWYVSMDGNQEGPYTLAQAQKWVTQKPFEAELHCWSEGFDDWLPIDKVSHFRNLRKRAVQKAPTIPPPIPKQQPRGEEPKALFAATMASIEKSASQRLPSINQAPTLQSHSAVPAPARANGMGSPFPMAARGTAPEPAFRQDPGDQMTAVEAPAFNDEVSPTAEPAAARAAAKPAATSPVKPIFHDEPEDEGDGLEIGEVSRVVKLADIAGMNKPRAATASNAAIRQSQPGLAPAAAVARASGLTGSVQKLSPSELGMNVDPSLASSLAPVGAPAPDESMVAQSFAQRHRRGMMLLIGFSAMMVLGVIALVVFVVSGGEGDLPVGLGGTRVIDTSRPEDIVRKQLPPTPNEVKNTTTRPKYTPRNTGQITTQQPEGPETGPGSSLDASEVEAMAAKYGEGTKRCYMRAQKGALGFEIAETKKIDVTLTVAKDGSVNDVQLSKHAGNEFGQCLISRIKGWRFRESRGGTFRIALAFSSG